MTPSGYAISKLLAECEYPVEDIDPRSRDAMAEISREIVGIRSPEDAARVRDSLRRGESEGRIQKVYVESLQAAICNRLREYEQAEVHNQNVERLAAEDGGPFEQPRLASAFRHRGIRHFYELQEDLEDAWRCFTRAVEMHPGIQNIQNLLAVFWLKDPNKAEAFFLEISDEAPKLFVKELHTRVMNDPDLRFYRPLLQEKEESRS